MSRPEAGPSRPRRRHTHRACNTCRRRRCKCDGGQPICGTCSSSGHECAWTTDNDDGRPATKQYIESLRIKIQLLESEIAQLRKGNPQAISSSSSSNTPSGAVHGSVALLESLPHVGASRDTTRPGVLPQYGTPPEPRVGITSPLSPSLDFQSEPLQSFSHLPLQPPPTIVYQYLFNIDTSVPFKDQTPQNQASLVCEWNRYLPDLGVVLFSRFEHDMILSRCFNYGGGWLSGLIPDLFLRELVDYLRPEYEATHPSRELQHYTPLLHCSLLAFGAAFSDDPEIRARNTRDRFAAHAKRWLDEEFSRPNPSLILSLWLLSEYHSGVGETNIGHMYMGMSMRASQARPESSAVNSVTRNWYCWSTFVQEKLMALGSGTPSEMPVPKVPLSPPIDVELSGRLRSTCSTEALFGDKDYSRSVVECFIQSCKLIVIATRMIDHMTYNDSTVIDIHVQLDSWFNSLPDGLLIRQRSSLIPPHVLSLHMCYWWLILHLHFPLLDRDREGVSAGEAVTDMSIKVCDRATDKLVQLFGTFDRQYGFRYLPRNILQSIYTCGCALLHERAMAPGAAFKKRAAVQDGVETCIYALRAIGETWSCALFLGEKLEARVASSGPFP